MKYIFNFLIHHLFFIFSKVENYLTNRFLTEMSQNKKNQTNSNSKINLYKAVTINTDENRTEGFTMTPININNETNLYIYGGKNEESEYSLDIDIYNTSKKIKKNNSS
jgi:hypothetical protein